MSKKSIVGIISAVVAVAIIATLFFVLKPFSGETNEIEQPKETAPIQQPETKPTSKPTPPPERPTDNVGNFGKDKTDGSSVDSVDGFNKQEIAEALDFVNDYATVALSNRYFIGGDWANAGHPTSKVKSFATEFYSNEMVSKLDGADKLAGEEFINSVMPYVFYLGDNGYSSPSKYCANDIKLGSVTGKPCIVEGVKISDIKYDSKGNAKDGYTLGVEFTAKAEVPININEGNLDGVVDVTYDYKFDLGRNIQNGKTKYEIIAYDTSYSINDAREVNND